MALRQPSSWERAKHGCLVTFENAAGERRTMHRSGSPLQGIQDMCAAALRLDPTYRVISYSTPESIAADCDGARADYIGPGGHTQRPNLPEASVLSRAGLTEMLHPRLALVGDPAKAKQQRERARARRDAARKDQPT